MLSQPDNDFEQLAELDEMVDKFDDFVELAG